MHCHTIEFQARDGHYGLCHIVFLLHNSFVDAPESQRSPQLIFRVEGTRASTNTKIIPINLSFAVYALSLTYLLLTRCSSAIPTKVLVVVIVPDDARRPSFVHGGLNETVDFRAKITNLYRA